MHHDLESEGLMTRTKQGVEPEQNGTQQNNNWTATKEWLGLNGRGTFARVVVYSIYRW